MKIRLKSVLLSVAILAAFFLAVYLFTNLTTAVVLTSIFLLIGLAGVFFT